MSAKISRSFLHRDTFSVVFHTLMNTPEMFLKRESQFATAKEVPPLFLLHSATSLKVLGNSSFCLKPVAMRFREEDGERGENWIKTTGVGQGKEGRLFAPK